MRVFLAFVALTIVFQGQVAAQGKKNDPPKLEQTVTEFMGRPVEHWIKELHNKDQAKAEYAVKAILYFGPEKEALALPEIIKIHSTFPPPAFSAVAPVDPSMRRALTTAIGIILSKNKNSPLFFSGVNRLRASLKDPQYTVRLRALAALQLLGHSAASATDDVLTVARDLTSWELREAALATLTPISFDPKTGVERKVFTEMYAAAEKDLCYKVRLAAIDTMLRALNLKDAKAKTEFETRMDSLAVFDADPMVKLRASWAVMVVKDEVVLKNVKQIAKLMDDPDPAVRLEAISTATKVGIIKKNTAFIADLMRCLNDKELVNRLGAMQGLGASGKLAEPAVPVLEALLQDKDRTMVLGAMRALGAMGPTAKPAVGALIKKLDSTDLEIADTAVEALGNMAEGAVDAVGPLINKLGDANLTIRGDAMLALARIKDKRAVEPLLKQVADPNTNVQIAAIQALGAMGPTASAAVRPLIAMLQVKDLTVRLPVIQTLGNIKDKEAVNPLIAQLSDTNVKVVETSLIGLGSMGPEAKDAVSPIARKLSDPEPEVVYYGIFALAAIGPAAKDAVPELQRVADNPKKHPEIRRLATQAIDVILEKSKKKTTGK